MVQSKTRAHGARSSTIHSHVTAIRPSVPTSQELCLRTIYLKLHSTRRAMPTSSPTRSSAGTARHGSPLTRCAERSSRGTRGSLPLNEPELNVAAAPGRTLPGHDVPCKGSKPGRKNKGALAHASHGRRHSGRPISKRTRGFRTEPLCRIV